ncbi:uncharacterized protein LOC114881288 isoform X2 [Osmia bicornis bicornis]|uniref:uncharacterized protein LOC114881288 isoform X2 n=1 Tax=Osmia bicornis bicornis TaxID=1437191 RepID=UPI001EAE89F2|nr:uncharacterized protein LOC114881288 isoform X2 [Osmia bicornis bicornis]
MLLPSTCRPRASSNSEKLDDSSKDEDVLVITSDETSRDVPATDDSTKDVVAEDVEACSDSVKDVSTLDAVTEDILGESYHSLMYLFRIPVCTISKIIPEVCKALYDTLHEEYLKVPST